MSHPVWHNKSMARKNGLGSNQYQTKSGQPNLAPASSVTLMQQAQTATPPARTRCGDVWRTNCQAWVGPPDYTHQSNHRRWTSDHNFPDGISSEILIDLSKSSLAPVRGAVGAHANCPQWLRDQLCTDPSPEVRGRAMAATSNMTLLIEAFNNGDQISWSGIASNPNSTSEMLQAVAQCKPTASVLAQIAAHPNCPSHLLTRFCSVRNKTILRGAVLNQNCTPEALTYMATIDNLTLRERIVQHPACPPAALSYLYDQLYTVHAPDECIHLLLCVAQHPACPPNILERFAESPRWALKGAAIKHPQCPIPVLNDIINNTDSEYLRLAAVSNPNCPPYLLMSLLSRPGGRLRDNILCHPNLPEEYRALAQVAH